MNVNEFIHHEMQKLETLLARRKRRQPENINDLHEQKLSFHDRVALGITSAIGTMVAVYILTALMLLWIVVQYLSQPFDPYPFTFLICVTSIAQMVLMPLIMVGQNLQSRHAELRAEEQYKTTLESYEDIEHVLARLEQTHRELIRQTHMLQELLQVHGKSIPSSLISHEDQEQTSVDLHDPVQRPVQST